MNWKMPPFSTTSAALYIDVNGVLTPFKQVPTSVRKYCRPLLFYREDSPYDLAYSGSSLLFRVGSHNFQLSTKHQFRISGQPDFEPKDSCLLVEDQGKHIALTPNGVSRVVLDPGSDDLMLQDISLQEYDQTRDGRDLNPSFLKLPLLDMKTFADAPPSSILLVFSVGYPSSAQGYDIHFNEESEVTNLSVVSRFAPIYLDLQSVGPSYEESRDKISVLASYGKNIGKADGWSGAPIFFIWRDPGDVAHLGFGGMITHGGDDGTFLFYRGSDIQTVVSGILQTPPNLV